ncbi:metal ABC transporter permease [Bradyrhizobium sp. SYSU BS000235]|uniref:metal ABC transporter permease n=1 Tax=Bradyrhizobium sp. SYSU BS000235 TaxID=3411332 RepID=UPI003C78989A
MSETLGFLWPPFLVAVCLVGIHTYFGIQVLARKVIFVDLALAQIAALGATVAFMLGHPAQSPATYFYSLAFTLLAAVLLALTRTWGARVPQEALIGVIYVVAAAAAILLIDRAPQGAEHLKQILTGNILTSGLGEVAIIVPLYAAIGLMQWLLRSRLSGGGSLIWEFVFYASFGVVVTSSVAIAGVLLVFSFLIIPATIGVMFASSVGRQLAIGWIAGIATSAAGLAASFAFDLPTGAAMVCAFGVALAVAGMLYPFLRGDRRNAFRVTLATVRWGAAAIFAASALQIAIAPRADQPLLDMAEVALPSLRALYLTRTEQATFTEAGQYAERYRREAEQLNERERRNRTVGEALDDAAVARISSFLKSYGEMRKGEQFVMNEVRARARERTRWGISLVLLAFAALLAPLPWQRLGARQAR